MNWKQKLAEWLFKNDVGKTEFVIYCVMAALTAIWILNWIITAIWN